MAYLSHVAVLIAIYYVLAVSLNLVAGYGGLLSLAHAAFFGIGAYAVGVGTSLLGWDFWPAAFLGIGVSLVVSIGMSTAVGALRGDQFLLGTLAFQVLVHSVLKNWVAVTRGPMGLSDVAAPRLFGWVMDSPHEVLVLAMATACFSCVVCRRIVESPFGRVLQAIREDELLPASLGKNVRANKISVFAVSAVLAAASGAVYAGYVTFVDPTSFTIMESVLVLSMVIVGGAGSLWGPAIGAVVLVSVPEALRFVGLPAAVAANVRQMVYGLFLVVMMMARPQGLVGRYAFGR